MRLHFPLLAHCKGQGEEPRLREHVVAINEASRAELIYHRRIVSSQTAAAEKLDQRALLNPRQFIPAGGFRHRAFPLAFIGALIVGPKGHSVFAIRAA